MAEELKFETAREIAEGLLTIGPKREYWPEGAITAIADDLVRWCRGAILDNCVWPPEAQARWLVREARETWEYFGGTKALRELFCGKFETPKQQQVSIGPVCPICDGTGWKIVERITRRGPVSGAERCSCGGGAPVAVCPLCKGKESRLEGDKRVPCSCVSPSRRRQMEEIASAMHSRQERQAPPAPALPPGAKRITEADIEAEMQRQGKCRTAVVERGEGEKPDAEI